MKSRCLPFLLALPFLLLIACSHGGGGQGGLCFVVETLRLPASAAEADTYSLDLDLDSVLDHQMNNSLLGFQALGLGLQSALNAGLLDGSLIQLIHLDAASQADDQDVATVVCTGTDGDADPADNFSGSERFDVEATSVGAVPLSGTIAAGDLTAGPGSISLLFTASGGAPITLHLVGGRVRATVSESGLSSGIAGGGIPEQEVYDLVLPAIHEAILEVVNLDCPDGNCTSGSAGEALMTQYDNNDDNLIFLDEFRDDPAVQAAFTADLDLLDGTGQFAPNVDGTSDSLSFGIGFTGVRALFELP